MTPQDVQRAWAEIGNAPDLARALVMERDHYQQVIIAVSCGEAEPDPVTLAQAVMQASGARAIPEEEPWT